MRRTPSERASPAPDPRGRTTSPLHAGQVQVRGKRSCRERPYGIEEGEGLAGGLALAAAVAGDEEALHPGAQRVGPLPHRLPVGEELALPPTTSAATAAWVRLGLAAGGHLFSRVSQVREGFASVGTRDAAVGEGEAAEPDAEIAPMPGAGETVRWPLFFGLGRISAQIL